MAWHRVVRIALAPFKEIVQEILFAQFRKIDLF